jgi:hypothetical protein
MAPEPPFRASPKPPRQRLSRPTQNPSRTSAQPSESNLAATRRTSPDDLLNVSGVCWNCQ